MLYFGIVIVILLVIWLKIRYNYWKSKGVNGPKPTVIVGNLAETFLLKKSPVEIYSKIYLKYSNEPFVGAYRGLTPILIVRDVDLVKNVLIKDFNHFHDNNAKVNEKTNPVMARNPFMLKGERWKIVRDQITPSLTSGKLKPYYRIVTENAKQLVQLLKKESASFVDVKVFCSKYTLNTVSICAMGIDSNAFEDKTSDMKKLIQDIFEPTYKNIIKPFIGLTFPGVSTTLGLEFFPQKVEKRLLQIVEEVLRYREENNIVRDDFLDQIKVHKKSTIGYEFTNLDIAANVLTLILDGFESSATVMSFVLYSLATHPEVQDKLHDEIMQTEDNISYEQLHELPYLDAVINETLRMYPPFLAMKKECTKQYVIEKNNQKVVVDVGTPVIIPIYGFHKDPNHFPDPDVFDPERFLGENKNKIPKCAFLPFGEGRRICIGKRFGILQVKTGVYHVIKNFYLTNKKNTGVEIHPLSIVLTPTEPFMIKFTEIK